MGVPNAIMHIYICKKKKEKQASRSPSKQTSKERDLKARKNIKHPKIRYSSWLIEETVGFSIASWLDLAVAGAGEGELACP